MFAEASNARLGFVEEATWGTTPATPAIQRLRFKSESLAATLDFTTSEEITPAAAVTDIIPTGAGAGGDASYELSYGSEMITMIEHALRGTMDADGIIKASDAKKSMTLHKELVIDESNSAFFTYPGARVSTWSVDLAVDGNTPIGGTLNFLAKGEDEETTDLADSYVAANENPVFSMPHLRGVAVTDIAGDICFSDLSFTVENTLRAQNGKCTNTSTFPDLDSKGIGYGQRQITGNMNAYLANLNIYEKFKSFGTFSLSFLMTDGTRGFKVTMPKVKITEGSTNAEGNDSDVLQPFAYQALYDTVLGTDMIVQAIGNIGTDKAVKITDTGSAAPAAAVGTYYATGATENSEDVLASVDGNYAIWFDGTDTVLTDLDQVGEAVPSAVYFERGGSADPTGSYTAGADGTGSISGASYDPLA